MSFLEETRVLRLKTAYAFLLTFIFAGATVHAAIDYLAPNFMHQNSMLSFAVSLFGMSVFLPIGTLLMATDVNNERKKQILENANG